MVWQMGGRLGTYLCFLRVRTVGFGEDDDGAFFEDRVHLDFDLVLGVRFFFALALRLVLGRAALAGFGRACVAYSCDALVVGGIGVDDLLAAVVAVPFGGHHLAAGHGLAVRCCGFLSFHSGSCRCRSVFGHWLLLCLAHGFLVLFLDARYAVGARLLLGYDGVAGLGVMAVLDRCDGALVEGRAVGVAGTLGDVEDCEGCEDSEEEGGF